MSGRGSRLEVLVVGAGFGREFLHLYQSHPLVAEVGLCDVSSQVLASVGAAYGIEARYERLEDALGSGRWDAVHLLSPVRFHVEQTLAVLASGRACASAVPMATDLDGVDRVVDATTRGRSAPLTYMMMETALYQREYLHALALRDSGALGRLGYLSGAHMQDLDGFAPYWMGYPPMQYATHVVAPLLGLAGARARQVAAMGSAGLLPQHRGQTANPFGIESALLRLDTPEPLVAQVTVSFFGNARAYTEGFNVYGDLGALEWPSQEGGAPVGYTAGPQDGANRGRPVRRREEPVPDRVETLPEQLRPYVRPGRYTPPGRPELEVPAWHGGSHPHLVHEFVTAVHEGRPSAVDAVRAATITAPGIVAHESALAGGALLDIPAY
jgi:predicted dehydrogenase